MLLDNTEPVEGVGHIKWEQDWFRDKHGRNVKASLKKIVGTNRYDVMPEDIEVHGLFFMREQKGNGIQIRAKLEKANSVLLCTVYSDNLTDVNMKELFDKYLKPIKPGVKPKSKLAKRLKR